MKQQEFAGKMMICYTYLKDYIVKECLEDDFPMKFSKDQIERITKSTKTKGLEHNDDHEKGKSLAVASITNRSKEQEKHIYASNLALKDPWKVICSYL